MVNIFTHKKETKDFHLISFGKFGDKMRPNRYPGMIGARELFSNW